MYSCEGGEKEKKREGERRGARERRGADATIAGVWGVTPEEIRNESPAYRRSALAKEESGSKKSSVEQQA